MLLRSRVGVVERRGPGGQRARRKGTRARRARACSRAAEAFRRTRSTKSSPLTKPSERQEKSACFVPGMSKWIMGKGGGPTSEGCKLVRHLDGRSGAWSSSSLKRGRTHDSSGRRERISKTPLLGCGVVERSSLLVRWRRGLGGRQAKIVQQLGGGAGRARTSRRAAVRSVHHVQRGSERVAGRVSGSLWVRRKRRP